jgi:hypothetical protein
MSCSLISILKMKNTLIMDTIGEMVTTLIVNELKPIDVFSNSS